MACSCILPPSLTFDACSPAERLYNTLPALSIKQPFANLVVYGMKALEIRSRPTKVRGRVLICASLRPYSGQMVDPESGRMIGTQSYIDRMGELALFGKAIGIVDIVGCRPMVPEDADAALVQYIPGAYCWELANPVEIDPFNVTGQLGFFKVPAEKVKFKFGLAS